MSKKGRIRIMARDSEGRTLVLTSKNMRNLLKCRLMKHVEPEVREVIEKRRRKMRYEVYVRDIALELGVRFLTVKKILDKMESEGLMQKISTGKVSVVDVKYKITGAKVYEEGNDK